MVTATIPVDEKWRTRWEAPYLLRLLFTDIAVVAVAIFLPSTSGSDGAV